MASKAKAPGQPGRVDKIGQKRTKDGKFTKKLPAPTDPESVSDIVERRRLAIERAVNWRPTKDEFQIIAVEAFRMFSLGHSVPIISAALDLPQGTIRRAVAWAQENIEADFSPEDVSESLGELYYLQIADEAIALGDPDAARKAISDLMRLKGHLSTAPGTNVNVGVISEKEVSVRVEQWLNEQEGEVIDVEPREELPSEGDGSRQSSEGSGSSTEAGAGPQDGSGDAGSTG